MIIAVDAGMLGITDERLKVGVWRVAVNLLTQLGKLDRKNSYRLYSFAPIPESLMDQFGKRMENRVLSPGTGWMSVRLPLEFMLRTPDLFLGLAQALPRWGGRNIGFIYDLGFLSHPEAYPDSQARLALQSRKLVMRANQIITISQATKQDIINRYGTAGERISVAYPGVSSVFRARGTKHREKDPYVLIVASLKRGKNIPLAIRALTPPHRLLIAGSTYWLDPEIERTIHELKARKRVKFMGFVSDRKLSALYRGATAVLVPSFVEGFCLPVVEAMASGTPVIATNAGSLPEIVGKAGIVAAATEKDFARAMHAVATRPALRSALVREGIQRSNLFRWDRFARTVLSVINT